MLKPWVWVLIGTGLAIVTGSTFYIYLLKSQPQADFGDAPDGGLAYKIDQIEVEGRFPSLLKNNGARAGQTDQVWLGEKVDKEKDSAQRDRDIYDDGFGATLNSCAASQAFFIVQVANPGQATGTAYLNLFFDWNQDGQWGGQDGCASEWAVQNYPVDLSQQETAIRAYLPTFTAGEIPEDSASDNFWSRAVVTLNQPMISEDGTGEFVSGEVEDYGPPIYGDSSGDGGGKTYSASCDPDPAFAEHGQETKIKITPSFGAESYTELLLANNMVAKTNEREIKTADNGFIYIPKLDPPERTLEETVSVRLRYGPSGEEASILVDCPVWAIHKEVTIKKVGGVDIDQGQSASRGVRALEAPPKTTTDESAPTDEDVPTDDDASTDEDSSEPTAEPSSTPTLTAWFEHYTDYAEQGYPSVVGVFIKPTDTAGKEITNCRFNLTDVFSDPASITYFALDVNQSGDAQGWICTPETGSFYYNCSGSTALLANFKTMAWFYSIVSIPWQMLPSTFGLRCIYDSGSVEVNVEKR